MLPTPMSEKKERGKDVVETILNQDPLYDIICFQEVFDEDIREIIQNGLKSEYPLENQVTKLSDNDFLNEDSGLFFASKYPVKMDSSGEKICRFREFDAKKFLTFDWLADKGIFGAKVDISERDLFIFNTHLQSTEAYDEVREKQLMEIQRFMYKALPKDKSAKRASAVLMGDFNVIGDISFEYRKMISLLGYPRDLYRESHATDDPGYTWDYENNSMISDDDGDKQRLDYIFVFDEIPRADDNAPIEKLKEIKNKNTQVVQLKNEKDEDLSDHYGVEAEIEL